MKPQFLCLLLTLLVLLLGCGTKMIGLNVSVTDPNHQPLPARGTLGERAQKHVLNFSNGKASVTITQPKEEERVFLDISADGFKPEKDFYTVAEGQTIRIQLEPLPPRIEVAKSVQPSRLKPAETCTVEITVANTGEGLAKEIVIEDGVPKDFEYVMDSAHSSSANPLNPQIVGERLVWNLESLPPAEKVKISYQLRLSSNPQEGDRSTEVLVGATDRAGKSVPDQKSASSLYVEELKQPKLSIQKTVEPEGINNEIPEIKGMMVLENSGNGKAVALALEEHWPKGFTYKKGSLHVDSDPGVPNEIVVDEPIGDGPTYLWQLHVLPPSTRFTLTYLMTIDPEMIEEEGSQSTTVVLKAINERDEAIEGGDDEAPLPIDQLVAARRTSNDDVSEEGRSADFEKRRGFGSNANVGVNSSGDSGEGESKEKPQEKDE